jgi:hypothetical protein
MKRQCYQKAVDLDPSSSLAWNNLGTTYSEGDHQNKLCYRRSLSIEFRVVAAQNLLFACRNRLNDESLESLQDLVNVIGTLESEFPDEYSRIKGDKYLTDLKKLIKKREATRAVSDAQNEAYKKRIIAAYPGAAPKKDSDKASIWLKLTTWLKPLTKFTKTTKRH